MAGGGAGSQEFEHFIRPAIFSLQPQNKFAALDNEEEDEEEEITKEKEPPKQGKEKAKKAEQVCILVLGEGGLRHWGSVA